MAAANKTQSQVAQLYERVIQDVINNVRDSFLDDGVDEQVLQELKQIWETKLRQTKAVDSPTIGDKVRSVYQYPGLPTQKAVGSMLYQVPAQQVQLTAASQQGRAGLPSTIIYPRGGNIVLPSKKGPVFAPYAVQTLRQAAPQPLASGETITLATTSNAPQQTGGKPSSSNVIQVDGCLDEQNSDIHDPCHNESSVSLEIRKKKDKRNMNQEKILQVDGKGDSSSSDEDLDHEDDDDDDDDDEDDADDDENEESQEKETVDEEPLNSGDDDSDQDANELFDVENVVVCQYDKIHRAKAKWKFNLKVGIMNLEGKDHVFQKANGEADW